MKFSWNHNFKVPRDLHLQIYYFIHEFVARPDFQLKVGELCKLIFCDNSILKSISRLPWLWNCDREQIHAISIKNKLFIIFIRRSIRLLKSFFMRLIDIRFDYYSVCTFSSLGKQDGLRKWRQPHYCCIRQEHLRVRQGEGRERHQLVNHCCRRSLDVSNVLAKLYCFSDKRV